MFWIKFCLIATIVFVLISIVKLLLRNLLKIEKVKKEFFSFNHINELHRKIDRGLRTFSAITLVILSFVMLFYYEDLIYLILITVIAFMILNYMVRAFFEWKYTQYPKQSILTLTEMCLILIAIIIVIEFKLLGHLLI
ncbi:DUF4181 domain-containing protein [Paenibacillus macquariensis]|uniref:DUF4181 domain-containing protein n=1 Tax=Paenibacillus macquariensis TaxID=948756 RepID=A0ABY1KDU8_9BACL|nr:DUF4181 domain-containing protein [Paenibacillus macquariensis]MEC0093824.1 DUF4181 domain-containing protein [Paenibacillus macquariensis]OAB33607.1 hypothetical protein PMSM_13340 [Paenibacillus macquariensis subsp. macquariensis]SIR67454.1 protein of unknown function [Paenibacillus macquariensis]